jgi:DNA-binding transcriptional LysR family regulator
MATFAKVIDLNGFSAAARALGVPKAAVSRAIAELEAELGLPLMTRTTRRLRLTPAGERLLPACRAILASTDEVRRLAAELDADTAERYELIIRAGVDPNPQRVSKVLGTPPTLLCATPAYLQKAGEPATPADLGRFDLLTPETPPGANFVLRLANGQRREEVSLRPKLAVNDPALLHSAVAAGLGIGLLPEFLCKQGLATQRLKRVLPDWQPPAQAPLCAVYPGRLAADPRVSSFVEFLGANLVPALAG